LDKLQSRLEFAVRGPYSKVRPEAFAMQSLFISSADMLSVSYDLPDDVFGPGEVKPTRPKKKVVAKKRAHETSDIEVMSLPSSQHLSRQWGFFSDFDDTNGLCRWRYRVLLTKRPVGVGSPSECE